MRRHNGVDMHYRVFNKIFTTELKTKGKPNYSTLIVYFSKHRWLRQLSIVSFWTLMACVISPSTNHGYSFPFSRGNVRLAFGKIYIYFRQLIMLQVSTQKKKKERCFLIIFVRSEFNPFSTRLILAMTFYIYIPVYYPVHQ